MSDQGFSEEWHGTIRGQIKAFGHTIDINCHVYSLRGDGSCAFYGFIEGAHYILLDPEFLIRQPSIESSRPLFIERLKTLSRLYAEDRLKCPLTRLEICKFMLGKCKEQPGAYSDLWQTDPDKNVLANGREVAKQAGINVPSENLGRGEAWALSLLHYKTQFDEGYGRVLVDYLDGAVVFPVIVKRQQYSQSKRVTRSSIDPGAALHVYVPAIEFVHVEGLDIARDINKVPLAAWLLHQTTKRPGLDPKNANSHFELISRVMESEPEGDQSPLIFLDTSVDDVEFGGGPGRHASGTGPGDCGGRGPSRPRDASGGGAPPPREDGDVSSMGNSTAAGGGHSYSKTVEQAEAPVERDPHHAELEETTPVLPDDEPSTTEAQTTPAGGGPTTSALAAPPDTVGVGVPVGLGPADADTDEADDADTDKADDADTDEADDEVSSLPIV